MRIDLYPISHIFPEAPCFLLPAPFSLHPLLFSGWENVVETLSLGSSGWHCGVTAVNHQAWLLPHICSFLSVVSSLWGKTGAVKGRGQLSRSPGFLVTFGKLARPTSLALAPCGPWKNKQPVTFFSQPGHAGEGAGLPPWSQLSLEEES